LVLPLPIATAKLPQTGCPLVDELMKLPAPTVDGFSTLSIGFPQLRFTVGD
jgi:hypothetical protein